MPEYLNEYHTAIACLGGIGFLLIVQILVADVVAIAQKHTPGMPITNGHDSFIFRSARVAANTNETLAAFIALVLFCLFANAEPAWVNNLALLYIAGRVAHMLCYYLDLQLARSAVFGVTIVAMIGLFGSGLRAVL